MYIKGRPIFDKIINGDDDVIHTPCKDSEGNLYIPYFVGGVEKSCLGYLKIDLKNLPIIEKTEEEK